MRVLLDGFWWVEGPPSNRRVQRELVLNWAEQFPQDELILAVPAAHAPVADAPAGMQVRSLRVPQHAVATTVELPRLAREVQADVMFTHNFTPLRGRSATFIHDVLFQSNPEWFTSAERLYLAPIPRLARRAEVVLTSSESEAQRIRDLNPGLRDVRAIGLAVVPELTELVPQRPAAVAGLSSFLLSVGRLNVRKNLATTLEAACLSGVVTAERPLLVVGERDGKSEGLSRLVSDAVDRAEIVFLGAVSDAELAWLYANADLFVFLTLGEGYGLPPLEASAFGCPVLVSDIPVMREILHGTGQYVDPQDVTAAAQAIAAAVNRPPTYLPDGLQPRWASVTALAREAVTQASPPLTTP